MDQCINCSLKGDIKECTITDCTTHESWYVSELFKKIKKLEDKNDKHLEALEAIRFSGNNFDDTAIEMQKWAAWAMEPEKWIKPGTKLK